MSRRLLAAFVALVVLPLGALAWLSARLARAEVENARTRVADVARSSLRATAGTIADVLDTRRRDVAAALAASTPDEAALRAVARRVPALRQAFLLRSNGQLAYPSPGGELDREEEAFLRRTATLWTTGRLLAAATRATSEVASRQAVATSEGWHPWHQDDGLHLLYWTRLPDGTVRGGELDRMRLLADVVGALPDASDASDRGRYRLLDAEGRMLHQWGGREAVTGEPVARVPLQPPLSAWTLEYFDAGRAGGERATLAGLSGWLAALAVGLALLAAHVYRGSVRELEEARTRVSFVNQVSHELKTPLTNVRMYAELLETDVAEQEPAGTYARVIVAESQRLSRLIANVLTFGRQERSELRLSLRPGIVDEVVRRVLDTFRPSLQARGVVVEEDLAGGGTCSFDPDALEQILGNLLSNVEKYASGGGHVAVATRRGDGTVVLTVGDRGPGVPAAHRERVFEPFTRVSDAVTEGVSGTGLGLTIVRQLARLHGGDVRLRDGAPGLAVEVTLAVEAAPA